MSDQAKTTVQRIANMATPFIIVLLFAPAIWALHAGHLRITGKPTRDLLFLIIAMDVLIFIWIRAFSGMRLGNQALAVVLLASAQVTLLLAVRLEGFMGDGRPIWVWAWTPTPDEVFVASRSDHGVDAMVFESPLGADLPASQPHDCPAFRGVDRTGRYTCTEFSTDWKNHPPRELWRQPIGLGWSSFVTMGDYCITQEQRGEYEVMSCYEVRTGREVWVHQDETRFFEVTSGVGPRATPAIHDGKVYSLGATGILNCLEGPTGESLWSVDLLLERDDANCIFGMTGSPLVVDDLVIVTPGGKSNSVVAFDFQTGERVWSGGDASASYSSPQLAKFCGVRQILNFNAEGLYAHDLHDGHVLWSIPWISNPAERNNVCQPVVFPADAEHADRVLISSGYGQGTALFAVESDAERFSITEIWHSRKLQSKFSSVVIHDQCIYGLDNGILVCLSLQSGRKMWKGGHYGYGQLILVNDTLLVQCENGDIALVTASPAEHRELARTAALNDRTWNHPVVAGNVLLLRNDREAVCFDLAPAAQ